MILLFKFFVVRIAKVLQGIRFIDLQVFFPERSLIVPIISGSARLRVGGECGHLPVVVLVGLTC